ncbi:MAG: DUF429 domain-containing protein [Thermoleophilia bacterium]
MGSERPLSGGDRGLHVTCLITGGRLAAAPLVIGVDIAVARPSTLVALRGLEVETWAECASVDAMVEWIVKRQPKVVAIDAPCRLSQGVLADSRTGQKPYAGRVSDLDLRRRGISLYEVPAERGSAPGWMQLGFDLYDSLREVGFLLPAAVGMPGAGPPWMIEVYPHASFVTLLDGRPPSKRTPEGLRQRAQVLREQGLIWDGRSDHDGLDALAGALTGLRFLEGAATSVGHPTESLIWLPVKELRESYSHRVEGSAPVTQDDAPAGRARARPGRRTPGETTQPGYRNRNGQVVLRGTDIPGTDHCQYVYVLQCGMCEAEYGANGSDVWQRKCPTCQGGRPGLDYE